MFENFILDSRRGREAKENNFIFFVHESPILLRSHVAEGPLGPSAPRGVYAFDDDFPNFSSSRSLLSIFDDLFEY